jgi:hypothetical protein
LTVGLTKKTGFIVSDADNIKYYRQRLRYMLTDGGYDVIYEIMNSDATKTAEALKLIAACPVAMTILTAADLPPEAQFKPVRTPAGTQQAPKQKRVRKTLADTMVPAIDISDEKTWSWTPTEIRFGDIPQADAAYVVRSASWGRYSGRVDGPGGWASITDISYFCAALKDMTVVPRYLMLVTEGLIDRLKLVDDGWDTIRNAVTKRLDASKPTATKVVTNTSISYSTLHSLVNIAIVHPDFAALLPDDIEKFVVKTIEDVEDSKAAAIWQTQATLANAQRLYSTAGQTVWPQFEGAGEICATAQMNQWPDLELLNHRGFNYSAKDQRERLAALVSTAITTFDITPTIQAAA